MRPFPPVDTWPGFGWSPTAPPQERILPPTDITARFFGSTAYDALRIDVWGPDAEAELHSFAPRLLAWLRHLCAQPWIGDVDAYTESNLKHTFTIDAGGLALATPFANMRVMTPDATARPLTAGLFQQATALAASGSEPPQHWTQWFDAQNLRARGQSGAAIMALALSVEIARNSTYPRFAKTANRPHLGTVLLSPFDGTDLLSHLSTALDKTIHRSLERERPDLWSDIKALYVARHHTAHGRSPITRSLGSIRPVSDDDLKAWTHAVHSTLLWIEALPPA